MFAILMSINNECPNHARLATNRTKEDQIIPPIFSHLWTRFIDICSIARYDIFIDIAGSPILDIFFVI